MRRPPHTADTDNVPPRVTHPGGVCIYISRPRRSGSPNDSPDIHHETLQLDVVFAHRRRRAPFGPAVQDTRIVYGRPSTVGRQQQQGWPPQGGRGVHGPGVHNQRAEQGRGRVRRFHHDRRHTGGQAAGAAALPEPAEPTSEAVPEPQPEPAATAAAATAAAAAATAAKVLVLEGRRGHGVLWRAGHARDGQADGTPQVGHHQRVHVGAVDGHVVQDAVAVGAPPQGLPATVRVPAAGSAAAAAAATRRRRRRRRAGHPGHAGAAAAQVLLGPAAARAVLETVLGRLGGVRGRGGRTAAVGENAAVHHVLQLRAGKPRLDGVPGGQERRRRPRTAVLRRERVRRGRGCRPATRPPGGRGTFGHRGTSGRGRPHGRAQARLVDVARRAAFFVTLSAHLFLTTSSEYGAVTLRLDAVPSSNRVRALLLFAAFFCSSLFWRR